MIHEKWCDSKDKSEQNCYFSGSDAPDVQVLILRQINLPDKPWMIFILDYKTGKRLAYSPGLFQSRDTAKDESYKVVWAYAALKDCRFGLVEVTEKQKPELDYEAACTLTEKFENVIVGDRVWSVIHGWGIVTKVKIASFEVCFNINSDHIKAWYNKSGKYRQEDKFPELYWSERRL